MDKEFDDKIAALDTQLAASQSELDNDPDQIKLKTLQQKADDIRALTNAKSIIEQKKAKAVFLQSQIDALTQELTELLNSIK